MFERGRQNIVSPASLFPATRPEDTRVYTEFGANYWVTRNLTLAERLLMYDVPEMLIRRVTSDQGRRVMLDAVTAVPGKVLQSAAGSVAAALRKAGFGVARDRRKKRRLIQELAGMHAPPDKF